MVVDAVVNFFGNALSFSPPQKSYKLMIEVVPISAR